jgi:hypothetical protein
MVRKNPRLASPFFSPTLGPDTTSCSVLCLRKGSHAAPRTRGFAYRQCPPAHSPRPASGPLVRLAHDPSPPSHHAQRSPARGLRRLARPARAAGGASWTRRASGSSAGLPPTACGRPLMGSPSIASAACCSGRGSGLIPSWRRCGPRRPLTWSPCRHRPSTPKPPTTATMSMANAMAASDGVRERGTRPLGPLLGGSGPGAPRSPLRGIRATIAPSLFTLWMTA